MTIKIEIDLSWPQKGAKLFVDQGEYYDFSHFGWGDVWYQYTGYMMGYKEAADEVLQQALTSNNIARLDTHIFPILFLYRQYIELELKWIILVYGEGDKASKGKLIKKMSHDLMELWNEAKRIILENASSEEQEDIDTVQDYIEQFHKLDETSFSFRYPITKGLDQILTGQHRINLRILHQRMDELFHFFNGVDGKLSSIRDYKQEMEQWNQ
jgi:hypothetical protein